MSEKDPNGVTYDFPYMRTKKKSTIWRKIYNPDKGKFLGRTAKSWGLLLLFYAIFYTVLTLFFTICLYGLLSTIELSQPKWQLEQSLIGTNPGLGFRPISPTVARGSLIMYNARNATEVKYWTNLLDQFLIEYNSDNQSVAINCDFNTQPPPGKSCKVDIKSFGNCTSENKYGYHKHSPCIFLKLNRIFNWVPQFYDNVTELPTNMPSDLKDHIKSLPLAERKRVWVSCNGQHSTDKESANLFQYYPGRGFAGYYYPFQNTKGYKSPLIAVQIVHPKMSRIINIECRAWAKNIIYVGSDRDRQGSVRFEIMVD